MLRLLLLTLLITAIIYWRPLWRKWLQMHTQKPLSKALLTAEEARDILGVSASAHRDEIIQAHKRLMQKIHPDRGGSDYLASRVNLAKQILLKEF